VNNMAFVGMPRDDDAQYIGTSDGRNAAKHFS
jgi:hypothetical protein